MRNIKFLIAIVLSIKFLCISSYAHATTKQGNEHLTEPQESVRIVVEQSYRDRDGTAPIPGTSLPFESTAQRLLALANLIAVAPETKDTDYTLTIRATGYAVGAQYGGFAGSHYYYTGASLRGTATLERAGTFLHGISFSGEIFPPNEINLSRSSVSMSPSGAPFIGAFNFSDFQPAMVKMLRAFRGTQFLLNAVKKGDTDVRTEARKELIEMGAAAVDPLIAALKAETPDTHKYVVEILGELQDPRAIEPLIETLKVKSTFSAVEALKKITKQSVGDTYEAWVKWWQENKD